MIAKSDGNIYIQGVKDKLNSIYDSHTTKSFLGIKYKRTSDYVSDNSEKYKYSQLYGDAGVTLDSQGRLRVQGVDIQIRQYIYARRFWSKRRHKCKSRKRKDIYKRFKK